MNCESDSMEVEDGDVNGKYQYLNDNEWVIHSIFKYKFSNKLDMINN